MFGTTTWTSRSSARFAFAKSSAVSKARFEADEKSVACRIRRMRFIRCTSVGAARSLNRSRTMRRRQAARGLRCCVEFAKTAHVAPSFILSCVLWLAAAQAFAAEGDAWRGEWTRAVEAAKKEGQLTAYGGSEVTRPEILAAFNKDYPDIKVTTVTGHAADLTARILAERRGDKYIPDIIASGPNAPRSLYLAKVLDPIAPTFLLPEVTDQSKWYGGKHWYGDPENKFIFMFEGSVSTTGVSVNTKLAKPAEIGSYWDLVQPKWKGKILMMD